jgi:hypothetical protein
MNKSNLIRLAAAVLLAALVSNAYAVAPLQDVVAAQADFQYSAERTIWVQISVCDVEGAPAELTTVEILDDSDPDGLGGQVVEKGLTDATGGFERQIRVPATAKQLTVRVGAMGIANVVTLTLDDSGVVSHSFE